jgi:hypothetical protein
MYIGADCRIIASMRTDPRTVTFYFDPEDVSNVASRRSATSGNGAPPVAAHVVRERPMPGREASALGASFMVFGALLFTQLLAIWPAVIAATSGDPAPVTPVLFGVKHIAFHPEVALLLMVALTGSLGSLVELIRGFTKHAGRDDLSRRWEWWYGLRPVQGATLALIVYFALRGGLLGVDSTTPLSPYGLAAFAGLTGLFTLHAVKKLSAVFDTLFGTPDEDANIVALPEDNTRDDAVK